MITHLACIMDGNRRWAKQQGMISFYGHKEGIKAAQRVVDFCLQTSIPFLSLYTFSIENFSRPADELTYLFTMIEQYAQQLTQEMSKKKVRIQFVGDRSLFPANILSAVQHLEQSTAHYTQLQVNLLFCYGGQQEILSTVKQLLCKARKGEIHEDAVTLDYFAAQLWLGAIPAPELIIRTGGMRRLSNFLLYHAAYSELYFLDCLWPEITHTQLQEAVAHFMQCKRNFGT